MSGKSVSWVAFTFRDRLGGSSVKWGHEQRFIVTESIGGNDVNCVIFTAKMLV